MTLETEVEGHRPDEAITVSATIRLEVGVTRQGACAAVQGGWHPTGPSSHLEPSMDDDETPTRRRLREQLISELFFGDEGAQIAEDDDLFELGLDSLGINRIVVFAERSLHARIPDGEVVATNFRTLRSLEALVLRCQR